MAEKILSRDPAINSLVPSKYYTVMYYCKSTSAPDQALFLQVGGTEVTTYLNGQKRVDQVADGSTLKIDWNSEWDYVYVVHIFQATSTDMAIDQGLESGSMP